MTILEPKTTTGDNDHDDGLTHVMCCREENMMLCGIYDDEAPIDNGPVTCVVCRDLNGTAFCPLGLKCP